MLVDPGYIGFCKCDKANFGLLCGSSQKNDLHSFKVMPKHGIVERTFA